MKADLYRADHVDADHHKRVRFEIDHNNADNINNSDIQQHNDDRTCVSNGSYGVGMCKSSFDWF